VLTALPDNEQDVSVDGKPEPDTWTVPPAAELVGLSVIDGVELATVKVAEAESSIGLPVTVIV
jgi:hypothetical protein